MKWKIMTFFEKLQAGYYWFGEWCYCMTHLEDNGRDFFLDINIDYAAYEQDICYAQAGHIYD